MTRLIENRTPRELGYRMPAEWEQHTAIWLQWPGKHVAASDTEDLSYQMNLEKTWLLMAWAIHQHAEVCILAQHQAHAKHIQSLLDYYGFDRHQVRVHVTHFADVWHRDSGPVFVTDNDGNLAVTDWKFNGWGSYPDYARAERHIPETIATLLDIPVFKVPMTSEGGAIEVNGTGSLLATRSSIINENRNPGMSQCQIEQIMADYLSIDNFIWLSGAPPEVCENKLGDGTDYHIDIAARFSAKSTVLYAWTENQSDPRYPYLKQHLCELQQAVDEDGNRLELIAVELPEGGIRTIGSRFDPTLEHGSDLTDASYLNYLVTNKLVLVPAFGNVNDNNAQEILANQFPGRNIVPVPVVSLTAEGGAIHCVTQQQPARHTR